MYRGEILDRDGNLLVANEVSYDLQLQRPFLPPEELNSILLQLVIMFDEVGYTPPTVALPSNPQSLFEQYGIQNFMTGYRETICGIRLRMEQHNYNYLTPYNVAQDIGEELLHMVLENGDLLKGVEVIETSKRLIPDGTLMPHILGTAGPILAEDYDSVTQLVEAVLSAQWSSIYAVLTARWQSSATQQVHSCPLSRHDPLCPATP